MGTAASIQTNVTNITNSIRNEIRQQASASANTNCVIKIGKIELSNLEGCQITLLNDCYAEADAALDIVQNALVNFYNKLDNNQKQEAASWFTATFGVQTTVNNVVNDFKNTLEQTCQAEANANQNIEVRDISLHNCKSTGNQPLELKFINAGTAKAQCAIKAVNNLAIASNNQIANNQSQGMDWSKFIWPITILIGIIAITYIIITLVVKVIPSISDKIALEKIKKDNYVTRMHELFHHKPNFELL